MGPFFRRLADDIVDAGGQPFLVTFNGGDLLFAAGRRPIEFRGKPSEWPAFFADLLRSLRIDVVLLFGDCRPHHREARVVARRLGVEVGVFEEGYVRPDYVTLERFGVNGHSSLPRDPAFYRRWKPQAPRMQPVGNAWWHAMLWAVLYYVAAGLRARRYPHARHHRPLTIAEALPWIRSGWRKLRYRWSERGAWKALVVDRRKRYFLVPLQVHNDSQIHEHSPFESVEAFVEAVVESFARRAPPDAHLAIKHHPMDRGYTDYRLLLKELAGRYGLDGRLWYLHDQHLPTLLRHCAGAVVVNSTVGLQALHHRAPVLALGDAVYDVPGLTFQDGLDEFWVRAPGLRHDRDLYRRFRDYLVDRTQLNGNFYRRLSGTATRSGLLWCRGRGGCGGDCRVCSAMRLEARDALVAIGEARAALAASARPERKPLERER